MAVGVSAVVVVGFWVWLVLVVFGPTPATSGTTPVGAALAFGGATESVCPAGDTFPLNGCASGDYRFIVNVSEADLPIGDLQLKVVGEFGGAYTASGALGFSILNRSGTIVAQAPVSGGELSMGATNSAWIYAAGASGSSVLESGYTVEIDAGSSAPPASQLELYGDGGGLYSGTTTPAPLP